jgi:hypothetical protein
MLWYKSWLEIRWRALFALSVFSLVIFLASSGKGNSLREATRMMDVLGLVFVIPAISLAGAGIKTQSASRATKCMPGSVYFTLSLPVSRLRLLLVRAGLGLMATTAIVTIICCGVWALFPALRVTAAPVDVFRAGSSIGACTSVFYFLSVVFATFLEETWQMWGTMIAVGLLRWMSVKAVLPQSLDLFHAIGVASPLLTHAMPWAAMAASLAVSAILFLIALRVVTVREY